MDSPRCCATASLNPPPAHAKSGHGGVRHLPHFYFKLTLPIAVIFLALSLTARALAMTQPPNPALRGFVEGCENKPQPCWYGIVPGVTTAEEATNISFQLGIDELAFQNMVGVRVLCSEEISSFQGKVNSIRITFCDPLYFGDFIIAMNTRPQAIEVNCFGGLNIQDGGKWRVTIEKSDAYSKVNYFDLLSTQNLERNWRGFAFDGFYGHRANNC